MPSTPEQQERMRAVLAQLWEQHRGEIMARYQVLQQAANQLHSGELDAEMREQARLAAHKLAGVLGTFGRHQGTDRARRLELWLEGDQPLASVAGEFELEVMSLKKQIE